MLGLSTIPFPEADVILPSLSCESRRLFPGRPTLPGTNPSACLPKVCYTPCNRRIRSEVFACSAYRPTRKLPHCVRTVIRFQRSNTHGNRHSKVVQRRQGFWISEPRERRGRIRPSHRDSIQRLPLIAGRPEGSVQRDQGPQGLAG